MRNIRIISSQTNNATTFQSTASNWGSLKNELSDFYSDINNMKAIVRETRVTLESSDAILPTNDFTIILSMKKFSSGITESSNNTTRYKDIILRDLRTKLNNIFNDLLNSEIEEEEEEVTIDSNKSLTEEDKTILRELSEEGLI